MTLIKRYIPFVLLFLSIAGFSQDAAECQKIVELCAEAINARSIEKVKAHLSPDFTIAGQNEPVASLVFQQLAVQLGDTILSFGQTTNEKTEEGLKLVYDFVYKKKGRTATEFLFDNKNQIVKMHLFRMQVKKMNSDDTKVAKSDQKVISVPFEMRDDLIMVDVLFEGEQRKFLLDSGSPKVILNAKYVQSESGSTKSLSTVKGVNACISGMDMKHIEQLDFYGISLDDQEVLTLDLSRLERDVEIYGLIGYEMLKDYDMLFDYTKKELTLIDPDYFGTFEQQNLSDAKAISVPLKLEGHIPVVEATISGHKLSFGIDSGAEVNLISEHLFSEFSGQLINLGSDTLTGADAIEKEVIVGDVPQIKIGEKVFGSMKTVFSDITHLNEGYSMKVDGIVGYELLSKQRTLLSYARKEMTFY